VGAAANESIRSTIEKEKIMLKKLAAVLLIACFAGLAGCNTMAGAGKDIQKGGENLENSAEKHKSTN
jgi:predicted small secreted protein